MIAAAATLAPEMMWVKYSVAAPTAATARISAAVASSPTQPGWRR